MDQGTMETSSLGPMFSPDQIRKMERQSNAIRKHMSPRGELGLPPLLDQRRLEWGITDGAFRVQAAFDRILVFQIPEAHFANGTYGDTGIVITDKYKDSKHRAAPRGIVISAGLGALDNLRSHGIDLGHIVYFLQIAPLRVETDIIDGKIQYVLVMRDGDLAGSQDTAELVRGKKLSVAQLEVERTPGVKKIEHMYKNQDGFLVMQSAPWISEDY